MHMMYMYLRRLFIRSWLVKTPFPPAWVQQSPLEIRKTNSEFIVNYTLRNNGPYTQTLTHTKQITSPSAISPQNPNPPPS